jgi:hypothetical protein
MPPMGRQDRSRSSHLRRTRRRSARSTLALRRAVATCALSVGISTEREVERLLMPNDDHLALLVEHDGVAIGVASYEILNGTQAEIAVLVDDTCQGDGIAGDRATDAAALDDAVGACRRAARAR